MPAYFEHFDIISHSFIYIKRIELHEMVGKRTLIYVLDYLLFGKVVLPSLSAHLTEKITITSYVLVSLINIRSQFFPSPV